MLKLSMRIAVAAAVVAGSATVASAQGYDPNGANRFQRLVHAETAGFYLGELQGPLASVIMSEMASAPVGLYGGGPIGPYAASETARRYVARTAYAPRAGMTARQVSAPTPGYVTPQY